MPNIRKKMQNEKRRDRKKKVGKGRKEKLSECHGLMERRVNWRMGLLGTERLFDTVRISTAHHSLVQIHGLHIKIGT